MRIGFEAKRATHNFRGLGNYSRGLIEGLLKYSAEDELFLYSPPIKDKRGEDWVNSLSKRAHLRVPQNMISRSLSPLWRSFALSRILSADRLDIFHGLSHEIPYGMKGARDFKKIVTIHDLIYLRYPEFFPFVDRVVYNQKFKYACKNSDMVIAICEQTKEDLIRFLGVDEKKIFVHYQSCSPSFYTLKGPEEKKALKQKYKLERPYILNVGAFEERKNQLGLLNAFATIANKVDVDLVFVGQGKRYRAMVEQRVEELKLRSRVHFINVSYADLPLLYQTSSLFCFPSLFEGFGIPIVEALFSGIPVITSYGSCFPESAGPDSYYVDPLSREDLARGMLTVLEDKELQSKMINRGLTFVSRFHQRETTRKLSDLYTQVMG